MTTSTETPDIPVEVAGEAVPAAKEPKEEEKQEARKPEGAKEALPAPEAERVVALEQEKKDLYERLLRTAADFDNYRKRAKKEADDARFKAREDVLREILPVIDNLERALVATASGSADNVVEGVKMVLRQFQVALERFDVKPFSSVGESFDPARHEAISQVETSERPPGTVHVELQKGYMMGSRLLRPALVSVARAPAAPPPEMPQAPRGAGAEDTGSTGPVD
ncbi:MAG: nucleotide exchange factor GrpE [Deltaproteobacteria bacterium]|nr:nucleotide exchange factor GrpE [Deltaproteobacteria bacterium]